MKYNYQNNISSIEFLSIFIVIKDILGVIQRNGEQI